MQVGVTPTRHTTEILRRLLCHTIKYKIVSREMEMASKNN